MKQFFTVDFEDFCHDTQRRLGIKDPEIKKDSIENSVQEVFKILSKLKGSKKVTFFCTAQVAISRPDIIKRIAEHGHEIACHGFYHDNIYDLDPVKFDDSLHEAKKVLKEISGKEIIGFRAPRFSIPKENWAMEIIAKHFSYDSSLMSTDHRIKNYNPNKPLIFKENKIYEYPLYSKKIFNINFNFRFIGGTYIKILPEFLIHHFVKKSISENYIPMLYVHPYEIVKGENFWSNYEKLKELGFIKSSIWQLRQLQWLSLNNYFVDKLISISAKYENLGPIGNFKNNFN